MLLPYTVDVPMARLPIANWVLIAITCVLSLAILFGPPPDSRSRGGQTLRNIPAKDLSPDEVEEAIRERLTEADEALPAMALSRRSFSF